MNEKIKKEKAEKKSSVLAAFLFCYIAHAHIYLKLLSFLHFLPCFYA